MDAKAEEILARAGRLHLRNLLPRLTALTDWTAASAEAVVRAYAEEEGAKLGTVAQPLRAALNDLATQLGAGLGKIAQPVRVAVTGTSVSPPIDATLALLGRQRSLARIDAVLTGPGA